MSSPTSARATTRLILGLFVIALGVLFTLDNLDFVEAGAILELWPVVLLAIGVVQLLGGQWLGAFAWFLVGTVLLLDNLDLIDVSIFDLWPLLLVLIGINIIRKAMGGKPAKPSSESSSQVDTFSLLSGQRCRCPCQDFERGDVTAILGGAEIDLREANIVEGERAIDVFALWGGIDIRVPREWTVVPEVNILLGSFEDATDPAQRDPKKRLVVRGMALMGGVSVRN